MLRVCEELLDEGMLVLVHAAKASYRLGAKFCALVRALLEKRSEAPCES